MGCNGFQRQALGRGPRLQAADCACAHAGPCLKLRPGLSSAAPQIRLLAAVASLDRGLAANVSDSSRPSSSLATFLSLKTPRHTQWRGRRQQPLACLTAVGIPPPTPSHTRPRRNIPPATLNPAALPPSQMREASEVDALAARLEAAGGGDVALTWMTTEASPDESSMEQLAGTWRLIYRWGGGVISGPGRARQGRADPAAGRDTTRLEQARQGRRAEAADCAALNRRLSGDARQPAPALEMMRRLPPAAAPPLAAPASTAAAWAAAGRGRPLPSYRLCWGRSTRSLILAR
jgi:hypothetical protein